MGDSFYHILNRIAPLLYLPHLSLIHIYSHLADKPKHKLSGQQLQKLKEMENLLGSETIQILQLNKEADRLAKQQAKSCNSNLHPRTLGLKYFLVYNNVLQLISGNTGKQVQNFLKEKR